NRSLPAPEGRSAHRRHPGDLPDRALAAIGNRPRSRPRRHRLHRQTIRCSGSGDTGQRDSGAVNNPQIHARITAAFALLILLAGLQIALGTRPSIALSTGFAHRLQSSIPAIELAVIVVLLFVTRRAVFLRLADVATSARQQAETAAAHQELLAI